MNETIDYNERFSWNNDGWLVGRPGFGPYGSIINNIYKKKSILSDLMRIYSQSNKLQQNPAYISYIFCNRRSLQTRSLETIDIQSYILKTIVTKRSETGLNEPGFTVTIIIRPMHMQQVTLVSSSSHSLTFG